MKEHFPLPGTYALRDPKGIPKGVPTIERIVRDTLRRCGYPCIACDDPNCNNPDLCDTLTQFGCDAGGGTSITPQATSCIGLALNSGVLTATPILNPSGLNLLQCTAQGLLVSCETVQDCIGNYLGNGQGLEYNDETGALSVKLSTDANNCLVFGSDDGVYYDCTSAITTLNGISGNGASGNEIRLGGALDRNTSIDGANLYQFNLLNAVSIQLEAEGSTTARLSRLTLTDNPVIGAGLRSQMSATQYSDLLLDPDATNTELKAVNGASVGNLVIAATGTSMGVAPGQGGRRFVVTETAHTITNISDATTPITLQAVYIDSATDNIYKGDRLQAEDVTNGLSFSSNKFILGGSLDRDTIVNATTGFELQLVKDNVSIQLLNAALPGGSGEAARFYGDDGVNTADMGVYTGAGGIPTAGTRVTNGTKYSRVRHLPAVDTLVLDAGDTGNTSAHTLELGSALTRLGFLDGGTLVGLEIEESTLGAGNPVIKIKGLDTYADNAAAVLGGLPVDALYKTAAGDLRIRV